MDGIFGEFIGAIFEGVADAGIERTVETFVEGGRGERGDRAATYERYLCGEPRTLNINDQ